MEERGIREKPTAKVGGSTEAESGSAIPAEWGKRNAFHFANVKCKSGIVPNPAVSAARVACSNCRFGCGIESENEDDFEVRSVGRLAS